jgi:thioredoxin 1
MHRGLNRRINTKAPSSFFMTLTVLSFSQQGCMACAEQAPINRVVSTAFEIEIQEIDAVKNPEYIKKFRLRVTPTTIILKDGEVKERFEGIVHEEQLEDVLKKYQ